ncbi:MAG: TetR/AcrR family transcriptional regulator [Endomicrobium sp.]|jgi:AcrR family transcriptional regulator|nr:TetR/AcrR family transcriptional regulator [Endomicrobium sp.]
MKENINTEQKIIDAGIALAKRYGISGFTVRQLCKKAKVNLGLFHYHFASRENFEKVVLKNLYGNFMKDFEINISKDMDSLKKLEAARSMLFDFVLKNSSIISGIIIEIFSGNADKFSFVKENFSKHAVLLYSIIEQGKKEKAFKDADTVSLLISAVAPVIVPIAAASVLGRVISKKDSAKISKLVSKLTDEKFIKERMELSLKGILND